MKERKNSSDQNLGSAEGPERGCVVTVGTFDGVHRGHRAVLETLEREARERGLSAVVVTFDRHPLEVVCPARAPRLLMHPDMRDCYLDRMVEVVRVPFDESVRGMTSEEWMQHLKERLGMEALVIGYDNTFGCDGVEMSIDDYARLGRKLGVEVVSAPRVEGCSSSAARKALAAGDVRKCAQILGRPFAVEGRVVKGRQIGRTIGFPTANIDFDHHCLIPPPGVYAGRVILTDGTEHKALVNVGYSPTVAEGGAERIEAHLPGFEGDLYGDRIRVEFTDRLRDEKKFDSLSDLQSQITADLRSQLIADL